MLLRELLSYWDLSLELWKSILPLREAWGELSLELNRRFPISFGPFIQLFLKKLDPFFLMA